MHTVNMLAEYLSSAKVVRAHNTIDTPAVALNPVRIAPMNGSGMDPEDLKTSPHPAMIS
jgi:hypothetical protein